MAETMVVQIRVDSAKANRDMKAMGANMKRTRSAAESMRSSFSKLNSALAIFTGATVFGSMIKDAISTIDIYNELGGRINLVAQETVGLEQAQKDLHKVSLSTYTAFDATASLYARLGTAMKGMGVSHNDLIRASETVANTLRLSGASAQEARASMLQLSQAMASGVLAGDEYRSLSENNVALMGLLAESLGVTRGELKKMSADQKLTTEVVFGALTKNTEKYRDLVADLPITVGRALTNMTTEWQKFIVEMDKSTGWTGALAEGLDAVSKNLEIIIPLAIDLATWWAIAKLSSMAVGFMKIVTSMSSLAIATRLVAFAWVGIPGLIAAAVVGIFEYHKATNLIGTDSPFTDLEKDIRASNIAVSKSKSELKKITDQMARLSAIPGFGGMEHQIQQASIAIDAHNKLVLENLVLRGKVSQVEADAMSGVSESQAAIDKAMESTRKALKEMRAEEEIMFAVHDMLYQGVLDNIISTTEYMALMKPYQDKTKATTTLVDDHVTKILEEVAAKERLFEIDEALVMASARGELSPDDLEAAQDTLWGRDKKTPVVRAPKLSEFEKFKKSVQDSLKETDNLAEKLLYVDNLHFEGVLTDEQWDKWIAKVTGATSAVDGLVDKTDTMTRALAYMIAEEEKNDTDHWQRKVDDMVGIVPAMDEIKTHSQELSEAIGGLLVNSVESMASSLIDFAITGEQSFAEMTKSLLADIAKLILKMSILRALGASPLGPMLNLPTPSSLGAGAGTGVNPGVNTNSGGGLAAFVGGVGGAPISGGVATYSGTTGGGGANAGLLKMPDGGGGVNIVINNNAPQVDVTAKEQSNGNGGKDIVLFIESTIAGYFDTGKGDNLMGSVYGGRRVPR